MENKHNAWDLAQMQSLSLDSKILMSQQRIRDWYEHFDGNVYVSVSGGKDSQVLVHLVKGMYPDVPCVFVNTGLEYDSVRRKGIELSDTIITPKMNFLEVLKKYGYPVISKEVSQAIYEGRNYIKALDTKELARQSLDKQASKQASTTQLQSDSRPLWSGSPSEQVQRIIDGIEDGRYP